MALKLKVENWYNLNALSEEPQRLDEHLNQTVPKSMKADQPISLTSHPSMSQGLLLTARKLFNWRWFYFFV